GSEEAVVRARQATPPRSGRSRGNWTLKAPNLPRRVHVQDTYDTNGCDGFNTTATPDSRPQTTSLSETRHLGRGVFISQQCHKMMIHPPAVDMEVADEVPLLPETGQRQHPPGGRIAGQIGGREAVQTHPSKSRVDAARAGGGGHPPAGHPAVDPVPDPRIGHATVLNVTDGQLADETTVQLDDQGQDRSPARGPEQISGGVPPRYLRMRVAPGPRDGRLHRAQVVLITDAQRGPCLVVSASEGTQTQGTARGQGDLGGGFPPTRVRQMRAVPAGTRGEWLQHGEDQSRALIDPGRGR